MTAREYRKEGRLSRFSLERRVTVLVLFLESFGAADHWSHWRGEAGNGISSTASPPTQWSETTNVKWRTAIPGRGSGSPVIWNNRVFVVSAVSRSGQRGGRMPASGGDW